ncbi:MAG: DUF669 domain-containing protein [Lachnospiraceae bacterium]|nr:DUF669 domain-containing protein [Lachnospiraceae bacterium]
MSKLSKKYGKMVSAKEERAIKKAIEEQRKNNGGYREVPSGEYPVVVDKMEVEETAWGDDQISIWFKITDGDFKNSKIFYNGMFNENYSNGVNATAILLKDMLDDKELSAETIAVILNRFDGGMDAIRDFIADAAEEVESLCYDLDYTAKESKKTNPRTGKPYLNKTYEIVNVFER